MKILIVSQYFWPENFRINDLALELQNRGHEVMVLTGWPNYPEGVVYEDFRANPGNYSNYHGVQVLRVPLLPRGKGMVRLLANYICFAVSASLLGPLKLWGMAVDRIFVFEISPITVGLPAIVLKYIKKAPIAFWVLDLWPETLTAVGAVKSKGVIKCVGILVSFIYKHCDLLLAQSRSFFANIGKYCPSPEKFRYFPGWAEDFFSQEDVAPADEVPAFPDNTFKIMFAGNIGDAQDFPSILDAAVLLKDRRDIRWLIVGDGRKADWVKQECRRRNLNETFLMLGSYPLERMPSFYLAADALLISLKAEEVFSMTIPGKVQTCLASGKPIIGMISGEGAAVIRESGAGYACDAGDSQGLADLISSMASLSQRQRERMGSSARDYYNKEFNKKVLFDRLESWLAALP